MSYRLNRTVDITLDKRSLSHAIKEVRDYQRQMVEAMNALIRELADQGAQVAKMRVASFDAVDSGALEHSIYGYFDSGSRIGYVIAGAAHAFYVEYGTGVVGAASPHPEAGAVGWEYAVGPTIHTTKDGRTGWFYNKGSDSLFSDPDFSGGQGWRFTEGQPSRPFMYNTFVWLEEAAEALGRRIFS